MDRGLTLIQGYQIPGSTNGNGAVRCVYLTNGATLAGFTLTNGATQNSGDETRGQRGGGVWCESTNAVLSNCVLTANSAYSSGGGAFSGTLLSSTLIGNRSGNGGGANSSTLSNCTVTANYAGTGGGTSGGKLFNCAISNNCAAVQGSVAYGGGSFGGLLNNCTVSSNSASSGGGAAICTLNACTLSGNAAFTGGGTYFGTLNYCVLAGNSARDAGGAFGGTLINCYIIGNSATDPGSGVGNGGGADGATLINCSLTGNTATNSGGGTYLCTLNNCTLSDNSAWSGGAACSGTLKNCVLTGNWAYNRGGGACSNTLNNCMLSSNSAPSGGGAYEGILNNCVLSGNYATNSGGGAYSGTLNNCTLTGNSAYLLGGGAYSATLNNCIVQFNIAQNDVNYSGGNLNYCCTMPLPTNGIGNFDAEPQLASLSHLSVSSPCRGTGSPTYANGLDIDGEAWLNPPSIGCDEYHSGVTGELNVVIQAVNTTVARQFGLNFVGQIDGRVIASRWDFGDGVGVSNRPYASHSWTSPGDYPVVLRAYNESYPDGVSATVTVHVVEQPIHFVALYSANPTFPYTSWLTAATTIQDAVDAASVSGALVLVTNGVYSTGGRVVYGAITNRVVVNKPVMVRSVNGPSVTAIQGNQVPGSITGDSGVRCVYLANEAALVGFTLTNGATRSSGDTSREATGGGVCCDSTRIVVSNCTFVGNSAINGGAAGYVTLINCTLSNNSALSGGGAIYGVLNNCKLSGNSARFGGGAGFSLLNNCSLKGNSASLYGGGAYRCTVTTALS